MNLKLIKKNNEPINHEAVDKIASALGVHPKFAELMYLRGIKDEKTIKSFLYPDLSYFHDPFLMKGMKEAVERINTAIERKETIVVYGDYDADGVCASAILSLFLSSKGLDVYTHIPSRVEDGYGLNTESIERIIENCSPDLILTCDCGISAHKEVEDAQDLGVEVIVTDHHEVSEIIPNCIVINPHQNDCSYPFENLCGAGVALKLVQALSDIEEAKNYLDLAALATVADLVPLVDENRLIVQLGLSNVNNIKNKGLKALLKKQSIAGAITSSDVAFKIAPRINAAGRMGDAYRAFRLLTTDNASEISEIISEVESDNERRKKLCSILYDEAILDMQKGGYVGERCIVLAHPDWEKGITGIVAARLAGEFHRPTFILVQGNGCYKGTARSVDGVNLYSLLTAVSDLLIEYGGHSQAAGFSILPQNVELFAKRVAEYLTDFSKEYFLPQMKYDVEIDSSDINIKLINSLDMLEPTGNGNAKPLFKLTKNKLKAQPCKNPLHTQINIDGLVLYAFNSKNISQLFTADGEKSLVVELLKGEYGNKVAAKGIVRGISLDNLCFGDDIARSAFLYESRYNCNNSPNYVRYNIEDLPEVVGDDLYGTLVVCGCKETFEKVRSLCPDIAIHEFLRVSSTNNVSSIIVSPSLKEIALSHYGKIVFVDAPISLKTISYVNGKTNAKVYVSSKQTDFCKGLSSDRAVFGRYYELFRKYGASEYNSVWTFYRAVASREKIELKQFVACLAVFAELGLVVVDEKIFALKFNDALRVKLTDSSLYCVILEYDKNN